MKNHIKKLLLITYTLMFVTIWFALIKVFSYINFGVFVMQHIEIILSVSYLLVVIAFVLILPEIVNFYSKKEGPIDFVKLSDNEIILSEELKQWMNKCKSVENKLSEVKSECIHWCIKYQDEVTAHSTSIGLRDERISELVSQVEAHIDYGKNTLHPLCENLKTEIDYYKKLAQSRAQESSELNKKIKELTPVEKKKPVVLGVVDAKFKISESKGATPLPPTSKKKPSVTRTRNSK